MVTNATFYRNSAANAAGGGIGNGNGGTLSVLDSTIYGNSAGNGRGGGIDNRGTLTLQGAIVDRNTAATNPDIGGAISTDFGHNLLGTALMGATTGTGDLFNNQPLLAAFANNSGSTGSPVPPTLALLPGSPARGKGVAINGITSDERGKVRPTATAPDIGAFQS
jgi:hypothetical protein